MAWIYERRDRALLREEFAAQFGISVAQAALDVERTLGGLGDSWRRSSRFWMEWVGPRRAM